MLCACRARAQDSSEECTSRSSGGRSVRLEKEMRCPLLNHDLNKPLVTTDGGTYRVECPVCGTYSVIIPFADDVPSKAEPIRRALAAYVRDRADSGLGAEMLTRDNAERIAQAYPPLSAVEKVDRLLRLLAKYTPYPGEASEPGQIEMHAVRLRVSEEELKTLRGFLSQMGLVSHPRDGDILTPAGWQKVWREHEAGLTSRRAFVAMWFDESLEQAWENGLRPGIEDTRCEAVRVDKIHHNEKICDRIVSEIRGCGFLVADVTGHRQGVYFEAGLGLGLGKPLIWTCRESDLAAAHFDTRQYNHIVWKAPEDLRIQLRDRIGATVLPRFAGSSKLDT